jgi:tetratricopeptide (TPR) repeat protein
MIFSRIKGRLSFLLLLLYLPGESREDPVELIRRHRYDEAIAVCDADLKGAKLDENALRALKVQSLAYSRLGSLYDVFHKFSATIMMEYYAALIEDGSSTAIHYLYLGELQFQAGKYAEAKVSLETARKLAGSSGMGEMADVFLFFDRKKLGEAAASGEIPFVPKDNAALWEALDLKGAAPSEIPAGLQAATQRGQRCRLQVLLRGPAPVQGTIESEVKSVVADGQQPELYLDQGKNTQINFYDPFLLGTLSDAYYTLSKLINLKVRDEEKKFPALASKFNTDLSLAEAALRLGQIKEAQGYIGSSTGPDAQLLKARVLAKINKPRDAGMVLENLASGTSGDPSMKRDIADCYYLLGLDLDKGLKLAAQAVKDKNGPNYYRTYANLLFAAGQTESAMQQYAKGYKIEYRNRIDQIDPEYMCDYAYAIFKTNKLRYEEIVETLYHLQKEFPACRQMHYCMQGISAGLARSYESQRIFRKGG